MKAVQHRFSHLMAALVSCLTAFAIQAEVVDLAGTGRTLTRQSEVAAGITYTNTSGGAPVDLTINVTTDAENCGVLTNLATIAGNIRLVKTGGGRLKIKSENSYTGGTLSQDGFLEAYKTNSFGAVGTTVEFKTGNWLYLREAGDYRYDFSFTSANKTPHFVAYNGVKIRGDIAVVADANLTIAPVPNSGVVHLYGKITMGSTSGSYGVLMAGTEWYVHDAVTAKCFDQGTDYGVPDWPEVPYSQRPTSSGTRGGSKSIYLYSDANSFSYFTSQYGSLEVLGDGTFPAGFHVEVNGTSYGDSKLTMNDRDQTIDYITGGTSGSLGSKYAITSGNGHTLTLAGSRSASGNPLFTSKINVVYEPTGVYTQTITSTAQTRDHTTSGSLATRTRGAFRLGGKVTFSKAGRVDVGANTAFVTGTEATALPAVSNVVLRGDFVVEAGSAVPFTADKVELTVAGGRFVLPADMQLSVKCARKEGLSVPAGVYTAANCDWVEGENASVKVESLAPMVWTKSDYDAYAASHASIELPPGQELVFAYDASMTSTVSIVISGEGSVRVDGAGGEITFSAANAFTGGFDYRGRTKVYLTDAAAAGSGTITVRYGTCDQSQSTRANSNGLWFYGDYVLTNPIEVRGNGTALKFARRTSGSFEVQSDIRAFCTLYLLSSSVVNFYGDIDASGYAIYNSGNSFEGAKHFYGRVTAASVRQDCNDWGRKALYIHGGSDLDLLSTALADIYLYGDATDENTKLNFWMDAGSSGYRQSGANFHLGADAVIDRLDQTRCTNASWRKIVNGRVSSTGSGDVADNVKGVDDGAYFLKMKGKGNGSATCSIGGRISVEWAPDGDYVFAFSNRTHATSGTLIVSRGTLIAGEGTEFTNLKRLVVRNGATFIADPDPAGAWGYTKAVNEGAILEIDGTGRIEVGANVVQTFAAISVNGEPVADGTYTTAAWKGGAGTVKVDSTKLSGFNWKSAVDGKWSESAKWSGGVVPTVANDAYIDAAGADYTVEIDSEFSPPTTFVSGFGNTSTLLVSDKATIVYGRKLVLNRGSKLAVTGDGEFVLKDTAWDGRPLEQNGGDIELSGNGKFVFSNCSMTRTFEAGHAVFRENSELRFGTKICDGVKFRGSAAQDCVVEFLDHAVIGGTASPAYNFQVGFGTANATAKLRLASDGLHHLPHALNIGVNNGRGELWIEGGECRSVGYGVLLGVNYQYTGVANCEGYMKMTGGRLLLDGSNENVYYNHGFAIGHGIFSGKDSGGNFIGGRYDGTFDFEGGAITNSSAGAATKVGIGFAKGVVNQSGGDIRSTLTARSGSTVIGMAGGDGTWNMTGGHASFAGRVYVGGCTTNELGKGFRDDGDKYTVLGDRPGCAKGRLALSGGSFEIGGDLVLSQDGEGTLELKPEAKLAVAGNLDARAGSKLVVDVSGWDGTRSRRLAVFGGTVNAFDENDITVVGTLPGTAELSVTRTAICLKSNKGTVLIFR